MIKAWVVVKKCIDYADDNINLATLVDAYMIKAWVVVKKVEAECFFHS